MLRLQEKLGLSILLNQKQQVLADIHSSKHPAMMQNPKRAANGKECICVRPGLARAGRRVESFQKRIFMGPLTIFMALLPIPDPNPRFYDENFLINSPDPDSGRGKNKIKTNQTTAVKQ